MIKNKNNTNTLGFQNLKMKILHKNNKSKLYVINSFQKAVGLIHKVYLSQLKIARNYTAFTKTKAEVRGGGRKPWKQKGTGQARAGSIRSPLWVGGGVIFGPKPHDSVKKINKKERILALIFAFFFKSCFLLKKDFFNDFLKIIFFKSKNVIANDFKEKNNLWDASKILPKTKLVAEIITKMKIRNNSRVLFIARNYNKHFWLLTRNLKNVKVSTLKTVSLDQILNAEQIAFLN